MTKTHRFLLLSALVCSLAFPPKIHAIETHRISVRQGATGGEFFDTHTGLKFTPRGNNYVLLSANHAHANFAPGSYNATDTENVLHKMEQYRYNTVRVFISRDSGAGSGGLSPQYLDNFTDFLGRAKNHNIYVIPTFDYLPTQGGYIPASDNIQFNGGFNALSLTQPFINAKKRYLTDFIQGLKNRNAALDYILGYALENEFAYYLHEKPFTLTSGQIQTASGSFNIASTVDRQEMMDKNQVHFVNELTATIKAVDPTGLVTMGFFTPRADPTNRAVRTYWIFADRENGGSSLDFVDLHIYPLFGSVASHMTAFEITSHKKPILIGEFGADRGSWPNRSEAVTLLKNIQNDSCQYNARGWLLWGWGTPAINWTGYYAAEENSEQLASALAPVNKPNPCTNAPRTVGDLNLDGYVNLSDYNLLVAKFGNPYTIFDYNNIVKNYGK